MRIQEVVVTGQEQVRLQESELDTELGPGEVLIETLCTFISSGTELANYTGKDPDVFRPGSWCAYPWRSGYANVGVVRAIGPGVRRAQVGQRVFTFGRHASWFRYPEERLIIPVPEGMDSVVAAASRMAGVAATGIIVAEIRDSPWVVVFGLGLVGNLAAQCFLLRGCRVIGVDPVAERRQLAQRCGVETVLGADMNAVHEEVRAMTGGEGAAITVDAVGDSRVMMDAIRAAALDGQVISLGTPRVPVEGNLTEAFHHIHRGRLVVRGAHEWRLPMYPVPGGHTSQYSKQAAIFDWIQRGRLQMEPLISHRMTPSQIKDAYDGLLHEPQAFTGVALVWE